MTKRTVVIADDHLLLRQGLCKILEERADLQIVGEAGDGAQLLELLRRTKPDLVLLDISMPHLRGIEAVPEIKRLHPDSKILIVTMHKDKEYLNEAISAGADGYLLKEDAEKDLFVAIDTILAGKIFVSRYLADESRDDWAQIRRGKIPVQGAETLSVREREVLKLIAEGQSSKQIGRTLFISARTVERHRANAMAKLHVNKTADLVKYALRKGYI